MVLADRLSATVTGHVQFLELTVPLELRDKLKQPGGAGLWAGWLRAFWSVLKKKGGAVWAYQRTHPCGDDGLTWHPHANFIFVQRKKTGNLNPDDLRREWAAIIGFDGEVNLFCHWADCSDWTGRAKLRHHSRYTERHFPGWTWAGLRGRWYGKAPKLDAPAARSRAKGICPCCGRPTAWSDPVGRFAEVAPYAQALLDNAQPLPSWVLLEMHTVYRDPGRPDDGYNWSGNRYRDPSSMRGG
jgi:hypothetical protein